MIADDRLCVAGGSNESRKIILELSSVSDRITLNKAVEEAA